MQVSVQLSSCLSPLTNAHASFSSHAHFMCARSGLARNPSPFSATSFRGRTTTSLLSSRRSSGVMIFVGSELLDGSGFLPCCCWLLLLLLLLGAVDGPLAGVLLREGGGDVVFRRGAGKLGFLSMASMRRVNLRKSASARIRVDSRSIVPESSLTGKRRSVSCVGR